MPFSNPILAGTTLCRTAIRSPDYAPGVAGWSINRDGTVEFNNAVLRGSLIADGGRIMLDEAGMRIAEDDGSYVDISVALQGAMIFLNPRNPFPQTVQYDPGYLYGGRALTNPMVGQSAGYTPYVELTSPFIWDPADRGFSQLSLRGGAEDGTTPPGIDLRSTGPTRVTDGDFQALENASVDGSLNAGSLVVVGTAAVIGATTHTGTVANSDGQKYLRGQQGSVSVTFASLTAHTVAVAFPVAFPSPPVVMVQIQSGAGPTARWAARAITVGPNGFTLFLFVTDAASAAVSWTNVAVIYRATLAG